MTTYTQNPFNVLPNGLTLLQQNPDCAAQLDPRDKAYGWHFLYAGSRLRTGEEAPEDGVWLTTDKARICESGLHGSKHPFDALKYAPGPILCLCEFGEIKEEHDDKFVSRSRRIIARMDATEMLMYFARMQALSVVHAFAAPDVVLDYLMTGEDRSAAGAAAEAAARSVAWSAAGAAAEAAARSAARSEAWSAARGAAWSAARSARSVASLAAREEFAGLVYECFERPLNHIGVAP
jgi:hypothetical protein